ncbi:MAG: ATP-dependent Clp protease proteolytic subunit [Bacteroidota bacterium]
MIMLTRHSFFLSFVCLTTTIFHAHAEVSKEQAGPQTTEQQEKTDELSAARKEQERIELENALNRARLEKELAALQAEVQRLALEKEAIKLRWEAEQEKKLKDHAQEMLDLKQQEEKIRAEVALAQAQASKVLEQFNLTSAKVQNQVQALKVEAEKIHAEIGELNAKKQRTHYAGGEAVYLKNPLQKDGSLVISDRRVNLNGVITDWKANHVTDRIQYFNNKDIRYPIFLVIEDSPGGSVLAGWRILKAMQNSQAPVYVVVKSFAASMAACITTLAEKSYAYPNAIILHHQPWTFSWGNVREQEEALDELKQIWKRLGIPIAKKMGISLKALDKKFYEKSARGDWSEFADNAKKLKWVDHTITGIKDSGMREIPDPTNYTWEKYWEEYYWGSTGKPNTSGNAVTYLLPLGPKNFYYLYNPNGRYQVRSVK